MKVMLEVFGLEYMDIEDNLANWKAKKMLKEVVTRDLAPFQMYKFYSDFEIMDTNMWSDYHLNKLPTSYNTWPTTLHIMKGLQL